LSTCLAGGEGAGTDGTHEWDKTQVYNNTIYTGSPSVAVHINGCPGREKTLTLPEAQARGYDPGTLHVGHLPRTADLMAQVVAILGSFQ